MLLLEAGGEVAPSQFTGHKWPYELPHRGDWQDRQRHFYPDEIEQHIRYTGGDRIGVDRIRVLGGRSTHWNAVCLRFNDEDFREQSIHGQEDDWPITYDELAPFYSHVERTIGVCGTREGLAALPDGEYYGPPPRMRCAEMLNKRACTDARHPGRSGAQGDARRAEPAGPHALPLLQPLHAGLRGRRDLRQREHADPDGPRHRPTHAPHQRARARHRPRQPRAAPPTVHFIDRASGADHSVRAGIIVVSCGAIESPRLLLNSKGPRAANGVANSSDLVGRYLAGHTVVDAPRLSEDARRPRAVQRRWRDRSFDDSAVSQHQRRDAATSAASARRFSTPIRATRIMRRACPGIGSAFKRRVRELQPALLQMGGFGKVQARRENRVTVDPSQRDRTAFRFRSIEFTYSDNDRALWKDMGATLEEIYHSLGTELFFKDQTMNGFASHEVGHVPHGRRSQDVGAQPVLPEPRRAQPLRRRRQPVRDVP